MNAWKMMGKIVAIVAMFALMVYALFAPLYGEEFAMFSIWFFLSDALIRFISFPLLPIVLVLAFGAVVCKWFKKFGYPYLLWHESKSVQFRNGIYLGFFFVQIAFIGFFLDYGYVLENATENPGRIYEDVSWIKFLDDNKSHESIVFDRELPPVSSHFGWYLICLFLLTAVSAIVLKAPFRKSTAQPFFSDWALPTGFIAAVVVLGAFAFWNANPFYDAAFDKTSSKFCPFIVNSSEWIIDETSALCGWIRKSEQDQLVAVSKVLDPKYVEYKEFAPMTAWIWVVFGLQILFLLLILLLDITPLKKVVPVEASFSTIFLMIIIPWVTAFFVYANRVDDEAVKSGVLLLIVFVGGLISAAFNSYRYRLKCFRDLYPRIIGRKKKQKEPPPTLIPHEQVLGFDNESEEPLIVVCTSGGGIAASVWTVAVLNELEHEVNNFSSRTRLITGASGGMVGAAYWVANRHEHEKNGGIEKREQTELAEYVKKAGIDQLSDVISRFVSLDLGRLFLPWKHGYDWFCDRGNQLEKVWAKGLTDSLNRTVMTKTLRDLWNLEKDRKIPSLVFSPMLVEDARRLVISNVDFSDVLKSGTNGKISSRSGVQLADLYPEAWADIPLTTAARLSASFPYVSPAANLPPSTSDEFAGNRRAVDAGYYDNQGVSLASEYLMRHRKAIGGAKKRKIMVILLSSEESRRGEWTGASGSRGVVELLKEVGEEVTGPLEGASIARPLISGYRNDEVLHRLPEILGDHCDCRVVSIENSKEIALSWYLTSNEIALIQQEAIDQVGGRKDLWTWINE